MRQRGFTLVSAIFLLVVIAALGAFAVTISTTQHQTSTLDLEGTYAYQASRAGIEWGIFQVLRNPAGITCSAAGSTNAVPMPATANTLTPFTVTVQCIQTPPPDAQYVADDSVTMYQIISTASNGFAVGSANYVERQISVTIAN
jgi:MSHA biogenesis protein MshP